MTESGDELAKELAPAIEKVASGRFRDVIPLLVGVLGTLKGGPIAGAAARGTARFVAELIATSADRRMQKEEWRLKREDERAEQLFTRRLDWRRLRRLAPRPHVEILGGAIFQATPVLAPTECRHDLADTCLVSPVLLISGDREDVTQDVLRSRGRGAEGE